MTDEQDKGLKKAAPILVWLWKLLKRKPFEAFTALVALVALIPAAITIGKLNDALESESYSYIITGLSDYDRLLIEHAELMPYLEGDQDGTELPLPADDPSRTVEIMALANYKLDFIDGFYSQEVHINWPRYTRCGWETYFHDSFRRSEALCTLICSNPQQYGTRVRQLGVSVCQEKTSSRVGACAEGAPSVSLPNHTAVCLQ